MSSSIAFPHKIAKFILSTIDGDFDVPKNC